MVDTRRPLAPRPPVRLRPAPPLDRPCTDQDPAWGDAWGSVDQLALDLFDARRDLDRPAGRAADRPTRRPGRSLDRATGRAADIRPAPTGPGRSAGPPPAALVTATPEAARAAHRFVRTFLEIVNGYRPPGQLRPLCLPEAAARVAAELTRAARRVGPARRRAARPVLQLRRLRVCEPRAGAVEAAAVLAGAGGANWAVALRLEHRRGTWLCTVLTVL
ncbi:Rv3235 family protein [Micromonospora sp. A3M-1-15]|uniref:Rv3235 family protein n=1 Tax=Micromonospora sp. A3M-1-15 TaxID=2962035 RepID=UPI0020B88931|nr:Rv3235 family protein [Micromonospora sp. A3M-1-15]MCP3783049.1 Rv3235 family protein [Micromonospora sp. A3M-1-15]